MGVIALIALICVFSVAFVIGVIIFTVAVCSLIVYAIIYLITKGEFENNRWNKVICVLISIIILLLGYYIFEYVDFENISNSSSEEYEDKYDQVEDGDVYVPEEAEINYTGSSTHPELQAYAEYIISNEWILKYEGNPEYKEMAVFDFNKDGIWEVYLSYVGTDWENLFLGSFKLFRGRLPEKRFIIFF